MPNTCSTTEAGLAKPTAPRAALCAALAHEADTVIIAAMAVTVTVMATVAVAMPMSVAVPVAAMAVAAVAVTSAIITIAMAVAAAPGMSATAAVAARGDLGQAAKEDAQATDKGRAAQLLVHDVTPSSALATSTVKKR
jgi:hypothetical protein